jgi:septal ring factor EnvC (AmiA/AmiB activator)
MMSPNKVFLSTCTLLFLTATLSSCYRTRWDNHSSPGSWKPPAQSGLSNYRTVPSYKSFTVTNGTQNANSDSSNNLSFQSVKENKQHSISLAWPLLGKVVSRFGTSNGSEGRGIDISAKPGSHVMAADDGRVAYVGSIRGYGRVVIIEHRYRLVTVYGGFGRTMVRKGMTIKRGHIMGTLANSHRSTHSILHFEVRLRSKPVDPLQYLEKTA